MSTGDEASPKRAAVGDRAGRSRRRAGRAGSGFAVLRRVVGGAAVIGLTVALAAWRMSLRPPDWYRPPDASDAVVAEFAQDVEYRIIQEAQRIRGPEGLGDWTLMLDEDQANAWLAARLSPWLGQRTGSPWPASLGPPQVRLLEGRVDVAVAAHRPDTPGEPRDAADGPMTVIVARFRPALGDDGLELGLESFGTGRLTLPVGSISSLAEAIERLVEEGVVPDAIAEQLGRVDELRREVDRPVPPTVRLGDGRRVMLRELRLLDGAVELRCTTGPGCDDGRPAE